MKAKGITPDKREAITNDNALLKRFVQLMINDYLEGRNEVVIPDDFFNYADLVLLDGLGLSIENLTIGIEIDETAKGNDIPAYFNQPQVNDGTPEVPVMRNRQWQDLTFYTRNDGTKIMFNLEGTFANFKQLINDEPSADRMILNDMRTRLADTNPTTGYAQ